MNEETPIQRGTAEAALEINILGQLEVRRSGAVVNPGAPKQQAMLAAMLLDAPRPVSARRLTELLWDHTPPVSAVANLRTYAARLRRVLGGERIVAREHGYQLRVEPHNSDIHRFTDLVEAGRAATSPAVTADLLGRALALWRGPAGDRIASGALLSHRFAALEEVRLLVAEEHIAARLAVGEHVEVIPVLRMVTAEHPLRERGWEQLMLALYRSGDTAGALGAYAVARRQLIDLLGVEPGPRLRQLHAAILSGDPALAGRVVSVTTIPRQLPPKPPLIGREAELDHVLRAARTDNAVVVIDGMGGVGKSTLAIYAAHRMAGDYPDGQLYIDLQGARAGLRPVGPHEALSRFLRALGDTAAVEEDVQEIAARFRTLLSRRRVLLVLDNADSATQVRPLLPTAPECSAVITSRRKLSILDATARVALDVLAADQAMALLGPLKDTAAARQIARLCGGLPLALRIVAARMVGRLDHSASALVAKLSDERRRLDELGLDDLAVRTCLGVSYSAIAGHSDSMPARTFPALGLLPLPEIGPEAVAALMGIGPAKAATVLDQLAGERLVEPSAPGRYKIHDLLRLYAAELATRILSGPERTAVVRRVLAWYVCATAHVRVQLRPIRRGSQLDQFVNTLPAVHLPAVESAAEATAWFASEESNLVALIRLAATEPTLTEYASGLSSAVNPYFAANNGRVWQEINTLVAEAARIAGDARTEARCLFDISGVHHRHRRFGEAMKCLRRALTLCDGNDLHPFVLGGLGLAAAGAGDYTAAVDYLNQSLDLHQVRGDLIAASVALHNLGDVSLELGLADQAVEQLTRCLALRRQTGDRSGETITLLSLGRACAARGEAETGLAYYATGLDLCQQTGNRLHEWIALLGRAPVLAGLGQIERARQDLVVALDLCLSLDDEAGAEEVRAAMAALD